MKIKIDKGGYVPKRAYENDAGYDLRSPVDKVIYPCNSVVIDTLVHFEIPKGYVGMIKSKSGLYINHDLICEGVVDSGYTGSVKVKLFNYGFKTYKVSVGDKIGQIVFTQAYTPELEVVEELDESDRGDNGFGSSGK